MGEPVDEPCEICGLYLDHISTLHRLADRIAKLEAAVGIDAAASALESVERNAAAVRDWPEWKRRGAGLGGRVESAAAIQVANQTEPHAALRAYLAQDKSLDELMPSPWQVDKPAEQPVEQPAAGMKCGACGDGRHGDCSGWCFCRDCKPAGQPVGAADEAAVAFWTCGCGYMNTGPACTKCGEPPAPAHGAPAEPLSERMREFGEGMDSVQGDAVRGFADEVAAHEARLAAAERSVDRHRLVLDEERRCYGILKAKLAAAETEKETLSTHCVRAERIAQERREALAAAERERDEDGSRAERLVEIVRRLERERDEALVSVNQAVAAERERCLYHIEEYEPRRDVPADWSYQGELSRIAETIRDGRQAPK